MIVLVQYNFTKQNNWLFRLRIVHLDFIQLWHGGSGLESPASCCMWDPRELWIFLFAKKMPHLFDISKLSKAAFIECLFLIYSSIFFFFFFGFFFFFFGAECPPILFFFSFVFFFLFFYWCWMSSYSSHKVIIICQKNSH